MSLNMDDERMIAILQGGGNLGDHDDIRYEGSSDVSECGSDASECEQGEQGCSSHANNSNSNNSQTSTAVHDVAVRQELGIGGAMTGPKGVINDRAFHRQQERARSDLRRLEQHSKVSQKALKSGWLGRQIEAEQKTWSYGDKNGDNVKDEIDEILQALEDEGGDDDFIKQYKGKRLLEMANISLQPTFGTFREIEVDEFVECVEKHPDVTVIVHMYQPQVEACRLVNAFLQRLALDYTSVKMVGIISTKADPNFDDIALPALLIYRNGNLEKSLLRITDEVDGWARSGRCNLEDFEDYLVKNRVLSKN
ncbi:hypothetical protein HDU77_005085 [Chytriomyces hyalinus]|nr:hypothetical protein HDU77_005085 [Chytriomyces hyalinus]